LDAADRLAEGKVMSAKRPFDWREAAVWAAVLCISWLTQSRIMVADEARAGHVISFGRALAIEGASHLVIAALIPAVYWMQRHFPLIRLRNLLIHALVIMPFSLAHTTGMAALRLVWFSGILGESFKFPLTFDRFAYEFTKDIFTYCMMNAGVMAFAYLRRPSSQPAPVTQSAATAPALPERFAVRKRGGNEVMVEVADIDWIEASGNYAILHVGGERFEIRSSLAKLEGELDPKRFVRVHKSHLVNIARVTEVTPWVSGDWRIRLQDGAEVNLSRRYRQRFEALAPVRS
jgi:LytTr DNA-binding domain